MSEKKLILDAVELQEWKDSLDGVLESSGQNYAQVLLDRLQTHAGSLGLASSQAVTMGYFNTISPEQEVDFPGDEAIEDRITSINRWNMMVMISRANAIDSSIGGHISTYNSISNLYEVGFNHFFRGFEDRPFGDLLLFQGHSVPGIYVRSFLEGRLNEKNLKAYRSEALDSNGISSYPHPHLMGDYWQFPTVSMGLGPLQAIYQAQFMRYLEGRGLIPKTDTKVWAFIGDGETDEPETLGAIKLAQQEGLDNLIFVVNCNLQRLDGPVCGNGKIIQSLEGVFRGAGWEVVKLMWGRGWDDLLAQDETGKLRQRLLDMVDGEYQNVYAQGKQGFKDIVFSGDPVLEAMGNSLSDQQFDRLIPGGHDVHKIYNAYHHAYHQKGKPSVVLAHTIKGYKTIFSQAHNTTHSWKKVSIDQLKKVRDVYEIPLTDKEVEAYTFYKPKADSKEMKYLQERRRVLNGVIPIRKKSKVKMKAPKLEAFKFALEGIKRENSTTMIFVRILSTLMKDKVMGSKVVPIIGDEARTFGMEGLFKPYGIYAHDGQKYIPHDSQSIMSYHESSSGQLMQAGLSEAGCFSSWLASAASSEVFQETTIPFFIFYSMFGFQRIGDLAWLAGDMGARGFLLGATAGRTTLAGEGLQHDDGNSLTYASAYPTCRSYDPTFAYELAVIMQRGLKEMYEDGKRCFYYITLMNENYTHVAMKPGVEEGIVKGIYHFDTLKPTKKPSAKKAVRSIYLLGSGSILREVIAAAEILRTDYDVQVDIMSATSMNELAREASEIQRYNMLHPNEKERVPYVTQVLDRPDQAIVVATDYIRAYANQIKPYLSNDFHVLGTDGYGRSDLRHNLRRYFEVDSAYICVSALYALSKQGHVDAKVVTDAMKRFKIDTDKAFTLYN